MKQPAGGRQQRAHGLLGSERAYVHLPATQRAAGMDVRHPRRIFYKWIISLPRAPRPLLFMIFDCHQHTLPQIRYTVWYTRIYTFLGKSWQSENYSHWKCMGWEILSPRSHSVICRDAVRQHEAARAPGHFNLPGQMNLRHRAPPALGKKKSWRKVCQLFWEYQETF